MAKILVVDDSETVRTQIKRDLTGFGFSIFEAADGLLGIEQAKQTIPDLILCDLNMPKLDGLSMARELRKIEGFQNLPILMLTTEASPEAKIQAKEVGIRAWIVKPYDAVKLNAAIRKILNIP